jgi:RNA polymerase sigma-70 factor (ECF subfamily)
MDGRVREIREVAAESGLLTIDEAGSRAQSDESRLVARARHGEEAAFDQLYVRYRDRMYTLCLNLCGDGEQAKDLLQETFVRAWRGLPKFREQSRFATWLFRIAVNVCRDAARTRPPVATDPPAVWNPDIVIVDHVRATLGKLQVAHRTALVLRYQLGLSYAEMSDLLHWSLAKVKVTLHRARAAFRDAYASGEGEQ